MRSGDLKHTVTIQRQSTVQDAMGQPLLEWATVATRRVSIEPLAGREFFAASGRDSEITTQMRIRLDALIRSVKPSDRVIDHSQSPSTVYDIESIINIREANREAILMCKRR